MNAQRRKALEELATKLGDIKSELEDLQTEEQEYFDNMPESFQGGEKGDNAQTVIDTIGTALDDLDGVIESINEAAS